MRFAMFSWGLALGLGIAMAADKFDKLLEEISAEEIDNLLDEFNDWIKTNQGKFAEFYAEKTRREKEEPGD